MTDETGETVPEAPAASYAVALDAQGFVLAVAPDAGSFGTGDFDVIECPVAPEIGARLRDGVFDPPEIPLDLARARKRAAVEAERDRRIDAGMQFPPDIGSRFQTDRDARENIAGAAQLATMAVISGGGAPGDVRWTGLDADFTWIADDNTLVPMDAPTMMLFGKAAAARKSACIFAARALKDAVDAAPDRYTLAAIDVTVGWPA